jgi:hypothetical protein
MHVNLRSSHVEPGIPPVSVSSTQESTMAKSQNSKKQTRKAPLKTAQQKRLAKKEKKSR